MKDRASRKRARSERQAARAAKRAVALARVGRIFTISMSIAVVGGIAAGVLIGAPRLEAQVAQRTLMQPPQIDFNWPQSAGTGDASWLPRDIQDVMLASALQELQRQPDPFSAGGLKAIADSALRSGWIENIRAVRRERDGSIRIDADWRVPTAVVRRDTSDYLVGRRGEILPIIFPRDGSPLKAIVGASKEPLMQGGRPAVGQIWPGADVQAGLELLTLISARPWSEQVAAIDVSEYTSRKELALITKWNNKVIWGGAPGDTIPGQLSTAAKLGRIDALQKRYTRIDVNKRLVDVTSVYTLVEDTATADAQR